MTDNWENPVAKALAILLEARDEGTGRPERYRDARRCVEVANEIAERDVQVLMRLARERYLAERQAHFERLLLSTKDSSKPPRVGDPDYRKPALGSTD